MTYRESKNPTAIFRECKKLCQAYEDEVTVVPCIYPTNEIDYFRTDQTNCETSSTGLALHLEEAIEHFKGKCDIIAHGSGADIFHRFAQKKLHLPNKAVSNIFLFAPDLNANIFTASASDAGKRVGKLISSISDQLYVFYSHGDAVLTSLDADSKRSSLGLTGTNDNSILPEIKNLHMYCCDAISQLSDPFRRHFYYDDGQVKSILRQKITDKERQSWW
jgi:Alpha/beta hydrolase of unknown function (DUF900)